MHRAHVMNMTEGKPLPMLARFAVPLLIGNVFQQAYNLADSMIVGRLLGAGALAAVGATGSVSFLFFSVCNGISGGGGVLNGTGDAVFSFINGIVEMICRIGLPLLLALIPSLGVWAIWLTGGVTWMLSGISCMLRYFSWTRKKAFITMKGTSLS